MAIENLTGFDVISDVGPTANSYASVEDTKASWAIDPYKKDHQFTDDEIGMALILATKQINTKYWSMFLGNLYDETYALLFPRENISDSRGVEITDFTIFPVEVSEATSVQAYYSASSNRQEEISVSGVKQKKMDGLGSQTFFSPALQRASVNDVISEESLLLLKPYLGQSSNKYVSFMTRG